MTDQVGQDESLSADFAIVCSSGLISKVMEEYFNKKMFRDKVTIVDLQPTTDGYVFNLGFEEKVKAEVKSQSTEMVNIASVPSVFDEEELIDSSIPFSVIEEESNSNKEHFFEKEYPLTKRDNKGRFVKG